MFLHLYRCLVRGGVNVAPHNGTYLTSIFLTVMPSAVVTLTMAVPW